MPSFDCSPQTLRLALHEVEHRYPKALLSFHDTYPPGIDVVAGDDEWVATINPDGSVDWL